MASLPSPPVPLHAGAAGAQEGRHRHHDQDRAGAAHHGDLLDDGTRRTARARRWFPFAKLPGQGARCWSP